jgi:hypothetical protein
MICINLPRRQTIRTEEFHGLSDSLQAISQFDILNQATYDVLPHPFPFIVQNNYKLLSGFQFVIHGNTDNTLESLCTLILSVDFVQSEI